MSCADCIIHAKCGGLVLDNQNYLTCFLECGSCRNNEHHQCIYACPNNPEYFLRELNSVGGLDYRAKTKIKVPSDKPFPFYVPQIHHGYRRKKLYPGSEGYVALALSDIFAKRWNSTVTPQELRRHFTLNSNTKIIALGVSDDVTLEKWWGDFSPNLTFLKKMGISAVTSPNYSVFENAPRSQTMINIARIHKFNERLSKAGLSVIPHIYAQTPVDWTGWREFLLEQKQVNVLAMEFQTGLLRRGRAREYINKLSDLQQTLQRPLTLLAIGGSQYALELTQVFESRLTLIDSTPFMKAMWRRGTNVIGPLSAKWIARHTQESTPVDSLFAENVSVRLNRLLARSGRIIQPTETGRIAA